MPAKSDDHLMLERHRLVLRLLEDLLQALTAAELGLRRLVEVGTELGEGRQLAELGHVEAQRPATCLIASHWASPPTRETEMPTLIAGRMPA